MQGIDAPTKEGSAGRTLRTMAQREENTPLLHIKKDTAGAARFERAGINGDDQPYINDVTDGMSSPLVSFSQCDDPDLESSGGGGHPGISTIPRSLQHVPGHARHLPCCRSSARPWELGRPTFRTSQPLHIERRFLPLSEVTPL